MARIIVCGYMIRMPLAGNILAFAQYLLGFARLGHSVFYVEESGWPQACYQPEVACYSDNPAPGMRAVRNLLDAIGASCPLAFYDLDQGRSWGFDLPSLERRIRDADLVLNLGGVCWLPAFENARRLALVDMDPLFTQVGRFAQQRLLRYDAHFTYGTNLGRHNCGVPTLGIAWQPVLPPVVPELWEGDSAGASGADGPFTTIANWSAYGGVEWNGQEYGQKDRQFRELIDLPKRTSVPLEIAVQGMPAAVARQFRASGWRLIDAAKATESLDAYRSYIASSAGEFSVAKHAYIQPRSGWISDRTVCYLAAGKPAVVQDTGVPSGLIESDGWQTFTNLQSAAEALDSVTCNAASARHAARQLANETFSYEVVLPRLLERAFSSADNEELPCAGKSC